MNQETKHKVIVDGQYETVIEIQDHYYIISKKHRVIVLPYTIDSRGLLDKIGVIKDYNYVFGEYNYTLLNGYINEDDGTNLVTANRILYDAIGTNVSDAGNWMYLGSLFNNLTSDSPSNLYCVNVSNESLKETEEMNINKTELQFKMVDSSKVITSDDTLLLAAYLRLFNFFYITSLNHKHNE